jgi:hypothetical protein
MLPETWHLQSLRVFCLILVSLTLAASGFVAILLNSDFDLRAHTLSLWEIRYSPLWRKKAVKQITFQAPSHLCGARAWQIDFLGVFSKLSHRCQKPSLHMTGFFIYN